MLFIQAILTEQLLQAGPVLDLAFRDEQDP